MADIYEFFDYREFLKRLYEEKKKHNPKFSYRFIAQKAGFTSTGFLSRLFYGHSNPSMNLILKLAEIFRLKKYEVDYLQLLVEYNRAKTHGEKKHFFDKIIKVKKSKLKTLDESYYILFSQWYNVAIREVLDYYPFTGDYENLAKHIYPAITTSQAKKAVKVLLKLGLIEKDSHGHFEKKEPLLATGDEVKSMAILNFQKTMLELARNAFEHLPASKRDLTTLTISISKGNLDQTREILRTAQREILELAKQDKNTDSVFQINFQVFPLTNPEGKRTK